MHKYEESKTNYDVHHVTSIAGCMKLQAAWSLLHRVYRTLSPQVPRVIRCLISEQRNSL